MHSLAEHGIEMNVLFFLPEILLFCRCMILEPFVDQWVFLFLVKDAVFKSEH